MTRLLATWQWLIALAALVAMGIFAILWGLGSRYADLPLLLIVVIGGIPLVLQICVKLLRGDLGADALAALAIITAVVLQQYLAATLIIVMLAGGQTLEFYAERKASSVLSALAARMPAVIHLRRHGETQDVPLSAVHIGDEVVIYPHETCPVDGVIVDGHGAMDESYLTGEPYHISKAPGATVLSGAINGESVLVVKTEKLPADSRYAAIVAVLQDAEQKRPKLRRLGDQIGAIFAPVALLFAIAAGYFSGEAVRFLAVLVIATPCPLLIAIPITLISAISLAAKHAIIIKDPTVLERLPTCRTAIFDKTGTLTYGQPTLTDITLTADLSREQVLQYAASLERYSKHPLACAILRAAKAESVVLLNAQHVSEKPGAGLFGKVAEQSVHVTSRSGFSAQYGAAAITAPSPLAGLECFLVVAGQLAAVLHFHDAPRADSEPFIHHLAPAHHFNKVMLVSGDRAEEVRYFGELLKVSEVYAQQTPEQKLAIVRQETQRAPTLYMGDGINDAPALTAATVGIAFGQANQITGEAAGAVMLESCLSKVDELIHLSINTRNIALQSALGGMLLSVVGMAFAAAGYIAPAAGAVLQEVIDILAIANALRLTWNNQISIDLPATDESTG